MRLLYLHSPPCPDGVVLTFTVIHTGMSIFHVYFTDFHVLPVYPTKGRAVLMSVVCILLALSFYVHILLDWFNQ
jgi:hypothetical protein